MKMLLRSSGKEKKNKVYLTKGANKIMQFYDIFEGG